jgi:hypothetical protein
MQESSSPRISLTGSRLAPHKGLHQTGIAMTDAARTERFDSLEARLNSLAEGNSRPAKCRTVQQNVGPIAKCLTFSQMSDMSGHV